MQSPGFVHLHTHSEFSLLDGACRIKDLAKLAAEQEMPSLALTDHGLMYGAISFYEACRDQGVTPIIGCEVYVAPRSRTSRNPKLDSDPHHLVLLAESIKGYKNLLKLVSAASVEGFYYKPRVDKELLAQHSEGLIALTACLAGEVPRFCVKGDLDGARKATAEYREIFGRNNLYIEIQENGLEEQKTANAGLIELARELSLPLVATNDIHYLRKEDASAHDVLLCIQTGATIDDPNRLRFGSQEFFFKTAQQMAEEFADYPESLANTLEIASRCKVELDFSRLNLPGVEVHDGLDADGYLEQLSREGLARRYPTVTPEIEERLRIELDTVKKMGYPDYMLIVRDFARFARERGIYVGMRGSAAGSIVCYALEITDADPLLYGLPFERFLNIERVSMPDIDMDFQDDRRDEVIRYVTDKYGEDHVAQIVTFGTLAARAAVRDVGRVLGVPINEVDKICKMIPTIPIGISIDQAKEENPELKAAYEGSDTVKNLMDTACRLEGICRHASTHAAGVIISHAPLTEHVPVAKASKGEIVSQYDAHALELLGLLKMDFLGLANLTTLARAVQNIKKQKDVEVSILSLPLDDGETYEMLGAGHTTGVFQLEGAGMRRYIQELKPGSMKELAAMIALYRPGPMNSIPKYIKCKQGQEPIKYLHPCLEPILKDSYGVVVYQDDVMFIARAVAGFSLGQADILRRAMGKKKKEEMAKQRKRFLAGAKENGISEKIAVQIFDLVEPFAGYGFNKAHATCYANVAYQTAYLKAHYPVEYMAGLLATNVDNKDKIALYVEECRRLGITVLPPDVNKSEVDFTAEREDIRFGLGAIKNCGRAIVDAVIAAREIGGPFRSLYDFCDRVQDSTSVGKAMVECLIRAGAFSSIDENRGRLLAMLDEAMAHAAKAQRDRRSGQTGLFGDIRESEELPAAKTYMSIADMPREEILAMEKDLLGLYVTDHPLMHVRECLARETTVNSEQLAEMDDQQECVIGGIISTLRYHTTKRGNEQMAFLTLEDLSGKISVTVFPSAFKTCSEALVKDKIVIIKGKVSHRERIGQDDDKSHTAEVICESVRALNGDGGIGKDVPPNDEQEAEVSGRGRPETTEEAPNGNGGQDTSGAAVHIRLINASAGDLALLKRVFNDYPGETEVHFHVESASSGTTRVSTDIRVNVSDDFLAEVQQLVGQGMVRAE
ncbi:MAG: DNA polymerase III subunit alpha [Armatimonadota bacterium]|nr:DNA polymerase III subunit alpha [Armatimonadota bacterium]